MATMCKTSIGKLINVLSFYMYIHVSEENTTVMGVGKLVLTRLSLITAGPYPGFRSKKRLGVLLLPLDGMLVHHR